MHFDHTNGKAARYMVTAYAWNNEDRSYFHYFKDALKHFEELKTRKHEQGTVISVYDLTKDERKAFCRV